MNRTPTIIQATYEFPPQPMTSSQGEAAGRSGYRLATGNDGWIWLYAPNDADPGNTIYAHNPADANSQGMGGAWIEFKTGVAGIYRVKGPWKANSSRLFDDTGVDLRDKRLSFVVLSLDADLSRYPRVICRDVIHVDSAPMMGTFDRGKLLAQRYADEYSIAIHCAVRTAGGGSYGYVKPTKAANT